MSADEARRLQGEARERYERDGASSYESGHRDGVEEEKINTDREKKRADEAEKRANEAEKQLEMEREELAEARKEIERLKALAN